MKIPPRGAVEGAMETKFKVGDPVCVKNEFPPGHIRTPAFVRGKEGVIERFFGRYKNPESLAYGGDGLPLRELYWVRFKLNDLWDHNPGTEKDKVLVEIYEHWLEPA